MMPMDETRTARGARARGDLADARETIGDAADGARRASIFLFNTTVDLYAYPSDGEDAADPAVRGHLDRALGAACARCREFEHLFSRTREDSDISRAHAAAPEAVRVAPETAELVGLGLRYGAASGGAFDITMGTVTRLWNFHTKEVPSRLALARALPHVGARHIVLGANGAGEPMLAIDDPQTVIDLGGIAKGYIADDLGALMRDRGVGRFVLNLGGNVLVAGGRPGNASARPVVKAGSPWRIGIVNPRDPRHHRAILRLRDGSVVTSGIHERSFVRGGVLYHHILDPSTGMPARTDVVSATIVADRSIDCDGWSTTAFMLGVDRALERIAAIPGVEAVLIDAADAVHWTPGIADALELVPTLPHLG